MTEPAARDRVPRVPRPGAALASLDRRTLLATAALALFVGLYAMNDVPIGVFQDDGHYLILARALAQGDGYRYINLPGAPPATHFPPGYPLLLAPFVWMSPRFPANVAFLKLLNVALLPLAALAIRSLAQRLGGLSAVAASGVAVVSVATVPLLFLNGLLFSETAFIAALCVVLMACEAVAAAPADGPWTRALGAGLCIGALAMLRTVGVALLPAMLAVLLWRRRWAYAALVLVGALAFLLPWQLWMAAQADAVPTAIAGGYGGYGSWLAAAWRDGGAGFVVSVVRENLRGLLIPLTLFGLAETPGWAQGAAVVALLTFALGGVRRLWPRMPVTLLSFVPYGALLLFWPFPPDRFLWPLWPVVLVVLGQGVAAGVARAAGPRVRAAAWAGTAVLAGLFATWHVRTWPLRGWEAGARRNARMGIAAAGVAATLPRGGLVASDQDAMVYLYAQRPAVPLLALTAEQHVRTRTEAELAAQLAGVLDAYHPRWALVAEVESLRAARELVRRGRLKLVGADPAGVILYEVVR